MYLQQKKIILPGQLVFNFASSQNIDYLNYNFYIINYYKKNLSSIKVCSKNLFSGLVGFNQIVQKHENPS